MGIFDIIKDKTLTIGQFNKTAIDNYYRTYMFKVDIIGGFSTIFKCEWVATTQTPAMTTTVQNIDYMHTQIKQAGRTTPQQWQVTVRDDCTNKAFNYFTDWRNDVYSSNVDILYGATSPLRYKRIVDLKLISSVSINDYKQYTIYGVWPFEVGSNQLSYDDENIVTFPITLSFDNFDTYAPLSGVI